MVVHEYYLVLFPTTNGGHIITTIELYVVVLKEKAEVEIFFCYSS